MKKMLSVVLPACMLLALLAGCGNAGSGSANPSAAGTSENTQATKTAQLGTITVISREEGSGTRGAFIELFGVEEKDANGNKVDKTTDEAMVVSATDVVLKQVSGDEAAIGYISLGSLNDTVKAVKIDGTVASAENIKNGTYKVARPFNIATKGTPSAIAQDFIGFILSSDGQKIVNDNHYVAVNDKAAAYAGKKPGGKVVVAGSSSVSPLMEKLREAYIAVNPNATVEIQTSDSTTGLQSAISGVCDIAMASRELKDSEKEDLTPTVIAMDGIAIILNSANPVEEMSVQTVKEIYTGLTTEWSDVSK